MHFPPQPAVFEIFPGRIRLVLKRKSGGRLERRRRGAGRRAWRAVHAPASEAPGGRPPRGCAPRNVRSHLLARGWRQRRAGRGAADLSAGGGASAGPAAPTARRAPRARSRSFPPPLRRRSAPLVPFPPLAHSLPPSLPPSPGAPRAPDGELAASPSARPLRLTWAPAPSPAPRPPNSSQVRGRPGGPRSARAPVPLDSAGLLGRDASRLLRESVRGVRASSRE